MQDFTLKGLSGATLQQPGASPGNGLLTFPLFIGASRSITVDGFAIHSGSGVGIGQNSIDVRLRNLTIDGAAITIFEASQVSLARVNVRDASFDTIAVYDPSDVHIEQCLFEQSTGASWHEGLFVGSGHVSVQNTTIRNMQVGIDVFDHGSVQIQSFFTYYPLSANRDVVIDSPAGTNFWGAKVESGSLLTLGDTKLRITNVCCRSSWKCPEKSDAELRIDC